MKKAPERIPSKNDNLKEVDSLENDLNSKEAKEDLFLEFFGKTDEEIQAELDLYMMKSDEEVNEDLIAMGEKPGALKKEVLEMIKREREKTEKLKSIIKKKENIED